LMFLAATNGQQVRRMVNESGADLLALGLKNWHATTGMCVAGCLAFACKCNCVLAMASNRCAVLCYAVLLIARLVWLTWRPPLMVWTSRAQAGSQGLRDTPLPMAPSAPVQPSSSSSSRRVTTMTCQRSVCCLWPSISVSCPATGRRMHWPGYLGQCGPRSWRCCGSRQ
jgi:glucose dehydrogenase